MKNKKIRAKFYKIPCYYTIETEELEGRNWFYDKLVDLATLFHQVCNELLDLDYPFMIELDKRDLTKKQIKEIEDKNN